MCVCVCVCVCARPLPANTMSTPTVLTLPSNASMRLYKDNKTSSFKVELPKRLMYSGFYDVGLTGFNYTRSWYSFPTTKSFHFSVRHTPHDGSPRERRIRVKPGHYVEVQDLLDQLNDPSTIAYVEFVYVHITHKINIIIKQPNYSIALSADLCHRLGWGDRKEGMNIGRGVTAVSIHLSVLPQPWLLATRILEAL